MSRKAWTEAELALLRDTSLPLAEVAERTGRPLHGVENRASRLGIRRHQASGIDWSDRAQVRAFMRSRYGKDVRSQWPEEHLALLADLTLSYDEVASLTGRSRMAVKIKAQRVGLHREVFWTQPDYEPGHDNYRGPGWRDIAQQVLERDGWTCQDGGEFIPSGRGLVVHHVIPWRLYPVSDMRWLVTLCRRHHGRRPEHRWTEIPEAVLQQLPPIGREVNSSPEDDVLLLTGGGDAV